VAFTTIDISPSEWTLIGSNVTTITFQNASQYPLYINFNSSNTVPTEEVGLVYSPWQGELKKDVTELTYKATPNYVFARTVSRLGEITVETA